MLDTLSRGWTIEAHMGTCMKILSWEKKRIARDKKQDGNERESLIKRQTERNLGKRVEHESGENRNINRNEENKIRF